MVVFLSRVTTGGANEECVCQYPYQDGISHHDTIGRPVKYQGKKKRQVGKGKDEIRETKTLFLPNFIVSI